MCGKDMRFFIIYVIVQITLRREKRPNRNICYLTNTFTGFGPIAKRAKSVTLDWVIF